MADRVIFVCILVLASIYFWATSKIPSLEIGDPLGPKAFPNLLGICLLATAGLLLVEMIKNRKAVTVESGQSDAQRREERFHLVVILGATVWTAIYFAVFETLGYLLSTVIFLLGLMAYFNRGKWLANILTSVLFTVLSYALFVKVLTVTLAKGILFF